MLLSHTHALETHRYQIPCFDCIIRILPLNENDDPVAHVDEKDKEPSIPPSPFMSLTMLNLFGGLVRVGSVVISPGKQAPCAAGLEEKSKGVLKHETAKDLLKVVWVFIKPSCLCLCHHIPFLDAWKMLLQGSSQL